MLTKKIIIVILSDEEDNEREVCIESLKDLKVNDDYEVSLIGGQLSNQLKASDVYNAIKKDYAYDYIVILRDNICILDNEFLVKILDIFATDENIGVLGIKGAEKLSDDGIVDKSDKIYGGYYYLNDKQEPILKQYEQPVGKYEEVEAISGNLMVVRGNVPMRPDIDMNIFAEMLSASAKMQGLKVVVPKQDVYFCVDTEASNDIVLSDNAKVCKEFKIADFLLRQKHPILTMGILTYNRAKYLKKSMAAIYNQLGNCKGIEVLISDNHSDDNTPEVVNEYKNYSNLHYVRQKENIGGHNNIEFIYENCKGDYVIAAGDDDYYAPGTIMRIVEAIYENPRTAVIELSWWHGVEKIQHGIGLDNFIVDSSTVYTSISSYAFRKKYYDEIKDKKKFYYTSLNQVYQQLEIIKKHPHYSYINYCNFCPDSGEAGNNEITGFKKEEQNTLCGIFIRNYYDILESYVGKGISVAALKKEKLIKANKALARLYAMADEPFKSVWGVDDDMEEIFQERYSEEPYYEELKARLKEIREIYNKNVK